ncbi:UNVERIFIED_CONTAM: hypothetical protein HDU68_007251 [Siphonaria sp. JEL0065]|nr:hypothetical protein HDU68_007251 [Siphonaria sp. JEL0065]
MRDKPTHLGGITSPRESLSRKPSNGREYAPSSKNEKLDARSQKEKDLAKEIRSAIKSETWTKLPDLLTEWEVVSPKDILVDCGIQFLIKERSLCEKTLEHVIKRGPLKGNEYAYASALAHLAQCQMHLQKVEECTTHLYKALKFVEQQIRSKDSDSDHRKSATRESTTSTAATMAEWTELKDFISVFLAIMSFRRHNFEETLRLLDTTANYQLVLKTNKFAFLTLLKAKSFCELRQPDEALRTLTMRQSQEDALTQIGNIHISKDEPATPPHLSPNPRSHGKLEDISNTNNNSDYSLVSDNGNLADGPASIYACHDLHIMILERIGREDEAKDLFKDVKSDGSKRPQIFKDFIKKVRIEDIGNNLIFEWMPKSNELTKRY